MTRRPWLVAVLIALAYWAAYVAGTAVWQQGYEAGYADAVGAMVAE